VRRPWTTEVSRQSRGESWRNGRVLLHQIFPSARFSLNTPLETSEGQGCMLF